MCALFLGLLLECMHACMVYCVEWFVAVYVHLNAQVPATETEALMSPLMPLLEKNRCRSFFAYCAQWEADKPDTWRGFDPKRHSMEQVAA